MAEGDREEGSRKVKASEVERRELAESDTVVAGSGVAITPRQLDQLISVRLDGGLVSTLREAANQTGKTVSALLRDAVEHYLMLMRESAVHVEVFSDQEIGEFMGRITGQTRVQTSTSMHEVDTFDEVERLIRQSS